MAEGRLRSEWDRTAQVMALLVNIAPFRKRGARAARPADFHPFHRRRSKGVPVSVERFATEVEKLAQARGRKR